MATDALIEFIKSGGGAAIGLITGMSFSVVGIILAIIGIVFFLAWLAAGIGGVVLWIWMVVDCLQRKFKNKTEKLIWLAVLVVSIFFTYMLLHILSAVVYLFVVRKPIKAKPAKSAAKPAKPAAKQLKKKRK